MSYKKDILAFRKKVVFQRLTVPHFRRVPKEYYENEACFIFVNEGEFSIRTAAQHITLSENSGILAKCIPYFYENSITSISEKIEVLGILLYPDVIEELFDFALFTPSYKIDYNEKKIIIDKQLNAFKESILFLFNNRELADEEMIGVKIKEFILIISKIENAPSSLEFLSALFQPAKFEFKETVENNLLSNLSIEQLADLTHMSVSSFKRKFNETYNDTPHHYINSKKIEKAIFKMLSSNETISHIAYEVGYDSLATFNRNFKKITGKSPSEFKLNQID
ncbi:MAG: helix-turn-helix transcriptional regulator [Bacteroidetes bacterium]|nr:helix-turn-helix transcriptional regulator [Bacteroidota bacterium]